MRTIGLAMALSVACGGIQQPAPLGSQHDFFVGTWHATSAAEKPPQVFMLFRAFDGTVRVGGFVFYPPNVDLSYVGAENLSLDGVTVSGHALVSVSMDKEFTVPFSITFDSSTHFTGTLGSVHLEGSR